MVWAYHWGITRRSLIGEASKHINSHIEVWDLILLDCVEVMEYETECTKRSQVQLKLKGSIIGLK